MENENGSPPPRRDQFEHRKDFVRAYDRWRDKNDPRRKAREKARTEAGYGREMYAKHQEKRLAAKKVEYDTKREMLMARAAKWRRDNPDKVKARDKRYYEADKARYFANNARRRARQMQATPPWLTREHWKAMAEMYADAQMMTETTGVPHDVDHIWPLKGAKSCGLHVPWNLQIVPAKWNNRKRNREPSE
jgi:hypothetical protein